MKILYLKLVNAIGIKAGVGLNKIEIDFNKSKNDIIMLFGGNGSGKTTIISSLHPFVGSNNDDRDKFFIQGVNGEKEIHYLIDDKVYMIRHYIDSTKKSVKTKSFISEINYDDYLTYLNKVSLDEIYDYGNELNENGGVTTFNELIKDIFDIDADFFKISRIGSNVTNFIDLSTSNRKKFISNFLPNIDEYLSRYKTVNEKYKYYNKEIKYLADEITKLGEEDKIIDDINASEEFLKQTNNVRNQNLMDAASAETESKILNETFKLSENNFKNYYKKPLDEAKKEYDENNNLLEYYDVSSSDLDLLNEKLVTFNDKVVKLNAELEVNKSKSKDFTEKYNQLVNEIEKINGQIKSVAYTDVDKLKQLYDTNNAEIKKLKDTLFNIDLSEFKQDLNIKSIENDINYYKHKLQEFKVLSNTYRETLAKSKDFCDNIIQVGETSFYYTNLIQKTKNHLKEFETELNKTKENYSKFTERLKITEILKDRPDDCTINTCPFIKTALDAKKYETKVESLYKDTISYEKLVQDLRKDLDQSNTFKDYEIELKKFYTSNKDFFNSKIVNLFNSITSFETFINFIITSDSFTMSKVNFDKISESIRLANMISDLISKNTLLDEKIKLYENNKNLFIELNSHLTNKQCELEKISNNNEFIKKEISRLNTKINNLKNKIDEIKKIVYQLENTSRIKENVEDLQKKYDDLEDVLHTYNELSKEIKRNKDNSDNLVDVIKNITKVLDQFKFKLNQLREFNERLKVLNEEFKNISLVKDALNPNSGIPVYFIDDYLSKTKKITNNLLNISQKGKFLINFDISEKDFFIKVYKENGDILDDIKYASQGESALTSLSLCLALIEQSMSKYNIFILDELDGALDDHNRRCFIDMVRTQMSRLMSEQVFIISHNNEFNAEPIDLILLKNSSVNANDTEFISNKNIIFQVD